MDEALELFPADYWRYFLIATRPETKDSNFSWDVFIERINADLNDTFGNFVHRTLTFVNSKFDGIVPQTSPSDSDSIQVLKTLEEKVQVAARELEACKLQSAANTIISVSRVGNQYLNEKEPWNLIKKDKEKAASIFSLATRFVKALAVTSSPFIPFAAQEIWTTLNLSGKVEEKNWDEALKPLPLGHRIQKATPLFKKIEDSPEELAERLEKVREKLSKTV